jgi:AraC-like DNA-binding protein
MTAPWLTAIGVPHLLRAVAEVSGDDLADQLAARFEVVTAPRFEDRIPVATLVELWEAALEATGRRALPVVASRYPLSEERSLVAFVAGNQRTVGDSVEKLARYHPTVSNAYMWRGTIEDGTLKVRLMPTGPVHRLGWQAYLEFEALDLVHGVARLTGGLARPISMRFLHPAPGDAAAIRAIEAETGAAVRYSADWCEVCFPASIAELPIVGGRPVIARVIEERLDRMLEAQACGHDVSARVRSAAVELMRSGECDVEQLARALRMSRRSLERALAQEGTSAAALIEDERKQLALAWLPDHSVDEVAARLGYSDARAFARAFKRWTGQAPRAARGS